MIYWGQARASVEVERRRFGSPRDDEQKRCGEGEVSSRSDLIASNARLIIPRHPDQ